MGTLSYLGMQLEEVGKLAVLFHTDLILEEVEVVLFDGLVHFEEDIDVVAVLVDARLFLRGFLLVFYNLKLADWIPINDLLIFLSVIR